MTNSFPEFSWISKHQKILQKLSAPGEASLDVGRFVGGAVRNTLLGKPLDDFDIATPLLPKTVTERLKERGIPVIATGIAHGTVTAILQGVSYEITTLREDLHTDGRWATVAYTSSWEVDASRRDFTVNAMYVDGMGKIYDYFEGMKDLHMGRIRFIGHPVQRIEEDYLRILRLFRFWNAYGRCVDPASLEACIALKHHLFLLSKERVTKEFMKILQSPWPFLVLEFLHRHGFLNFILGNEGASYNALWPQLESAMCTLYPGEICMSLMALGRLAMLISKGFAPFNASVHLSRLALSRKEQHVLSQLLHPLDALRAPVLFESVYETSLPVTALRCTLHVFQKYARTPHSVDEAVLLLTQLLYALNRSFPDFPVGGKDLLIFGLSGKRMGEALKCSQRFWMEHHMTPNKSECLQYLSDNGFLSPQEA